MCISQVWKVQGSWMHVKNLPDPDYPNYQPIASFGIAHESDVVLVHRSFDTENRQESFPFFVRLFIEDTTVRNAAIKKHIRQAKMEIGITVEGGEEEKIEKLLATLSVEEIKALLSKKRTR